MPILSLAWKSLVNRRFTAALAVLSIALSLTLLLGVERVRHEARTAFASTISGTDLIIGARGGGIPLLLYSVFRIGNPTNNLSWESYQAIAAHPKVAWTVPLSLGDSHRGFPVLGTDLGYFEHYRYARDRRLVFVQGRPFDDLYDAVLGAEVARALGYTLGESILVAHGASDVSFARHADKPFRVVGILARTGTPVDRTVHVRLAAIEALHVGWESGTPLPGLVPSAERARTLDLTPKAITAALVGLESRVATFEVQRHVNQYPTEPLTAILPGVALAELWRLVGMVENVLLLISGLVVLVSLLGMLTTLLTSLNERRREMAILRAVGARPVHIYTLVMGEAAFLTLLGAALSLTLLYALLILAQPIIGDRLGVFLAIGSPALSELALLAGVMLAGLIAGSLPGYRAYRLSLADGLSLRL